MLYFIFVIAYFMPFHTVGMESAGGFTSNFVILIYQTELWLTDVYTQDERSRYSVYVSCFVSVVLGK